MSLYFINNFFIDPKEPSPIPLIEAANDQDDSNQDGDGAAEQAENSAAEQVENGAAEQAEDGGAEQVENGAEIANVEVEPLMNGDGEERQSVTVKVFAEV